MSETISYENITFDKIFPQCRDDFNITISDSNNLKEMGSEPFNLCNSFIENNACNKEINYANLITICKGLVFYLYHIKNKNGSNDDYKKLACKYFNYKLQDMLKKYKCKYNDPAKGYIEMKQYRDNITTIENSFLDTCDNEVTCLEDSTFNIYMYFDQLYYALTLLERGNICSYYDQKFMEYEKKLREFVPEKNDIATLLNHLIRRYNRSILENNLCVNKISLTEISVTQTPVPEKPLSEEPRSKETLPAISPIKNENNDNIVIETIQIKHSGLSMGKWVGIVVFSSAILIMTFIIYKVIYIYTRNASLIRRRVKKLRKLLNIKSVNHNDAMTSSEETYKNRNHNQYKIAYI
ncbi:variable surface protein [Plasmodium gonderi]|uniref:Variable surface protein n=1 Tax=Plasmodium gonderi TaxID=77519 RepID=A0A1Y1JSS8_PLAGO|nr:variable surface protein [Plasmodium gonderi]GAW84488.1 variable surface protein [Plasmodium gonderi]